MSRILLAEDDNLLRDNISLLLGSEGYEVTTASNGVEALNCLKTFKPELILSDIMMPRMDGIELFRRIKKENATQFVPFIFLTAKVDLNNIREGMNLGADDYITKPFKSKDLLSTIKIRLKKSGEITHKLENLSKNIALYVPHELRTPLVSILGYSDILKEDYDSLSKHEAIEMLDSIKYSGQRLLERVEKFILFSELMTRQNEEVISTINSPCLITGAEIEVSITNYLRDELKNRILNFTMADALINVPCRYFLFIAREIVQNALKFSRQNTSVEFSGVVDDNNYVMTVIDHGHGLAKDQIVEISPFTQFEREKYQQIGNGLGLVIVKRIVEIFKGALNLESIPGNGTKITISFPVLKDE